MMNIRLGRCVTLVLMAAAGLACSETLLEPEVRVYSRLDDARFDTAADGLEPRFEHPMQVERGSDVPFTLTVTNTTDIAMTVLWKGENLSYDLVVTRPDSVVVWERWYGMSLSDVEDIRSPPASRW